MLLLTQAEKQETRTLLIPFHLPSDHFSFFIGHAVFVAGRCRFTCLSCFCALQKLLEEAVASRGAEKNDASRVTAELEESQKSNRALKAEVKE